MINGLTERGVVWLAIGMPGPLEIIVILLVILLLFGARRLPELARALGRSLSEFKKGREDGARDEKPAEDDNGSGGQSA